MTTRALELDGCLNFRDIGGYPGVDGRTVRWRQVFRSDSLHRTSAADVAMLVDDLGVRTAIDLRSRGERESKGVGPTEARAEVCVFHLPMVDDVFARPEQPRPAVTDMGVAYMRMLDIGQDAVAQTIEILASAEKLPAVFFCAAGKDRTGALAAVVLGLLGVSDNDISADYAETAGVARAIIDRARVDSPDYNDVWSRLPADALGAPAHVMDSMIQGIRAAHGTWERYAESIGVNSGVVGALREGLLE